MKIVPPTSAGITIAAEALRHDEIVVCPTETMYGLSCDPFSVTALQALRAIKGRREDAPILLIVADTKQLGRVVADISARASYYIDAFWPGPLSLLFPKSPDLPEALTSGSDKVCVRCPACDTARALCSTFGGAITSSSANRSGLPPVRSVHELGLDGLSVGIDAGELHPTQPSTVFDPDRGQVLREGAIPAEDLTG